MLFMAGDWSGSFVSCGCAACEVSLLAAEGEGVLVGKAVRDGELSKRCRRQAARHRDWMRTRFRKIREREGKNCRRVSRQICSSPKSCPAQS
jgi:hypothetical protein